MTVKIWFDEDNDPANKGWAYAVEGQTGPIDSLTELAGLLRAYPDHDVQWPDDGVDFDGADRPRECGKPLAWNKSHMMLEDHMLHYRPGCEPPKTRQRRERVGFRTWGKLGVGDGFALRYEGESRKEAALRSVTNRLRRIHKVAPWGFQRQESTVKPESDRYSATCGTSIPERLGGGMSVAGEVWVSIDRVES